LTDKLAKFGAQFQKEANKLKALGYHILLEFFDCDSKALNDMKGVEKTLTEAAKKAKANIVNVIVHKFNPFGVSGVVVISESHFSIHTWPEYGYAAIDIFSCGKKIKHEKAVEYISSQFIPQKITSVELKRGVLHVTKESRLH